MWKYIVQRLLWMIVVLFGVAILIFTITYFSSGNPAEYKLGSSATQEQIANMEQIMGIDQPYLIQLKTFLYNTFVCFDLGTSWTYNQSVAAEILSRLPRTLFMGITAMIITTIGGIPLGILAARHRGKWQDYGVIGLCMVLISVPEFWVALMFVIIFSLNLGWLPAYGVGNWKSYILPIAAMLAGGFANTSRQTRSSYLEVMRADFVTTVRAKGQKESNITGKHILPNALMPIITMLGGKFGMIVAGSSMIEKVFSIPGVGLYLLTGITYRDYPIIRGCALFFAVFASVAMLLTDLVYAWIDPRIRAQYSTNGKKRKAK